MHVLPWCVSGKAKPGARPWVGWGSRTAVWGHGRCTVWGETDRAIQVPFGRAQREATYSKWRQQQPPVLLNEKALAWPLPRASVSHSQHRHVWTLGWVPPSIDLLHLQHQKLNNVISLLCTWMKQTGRVKNVDSGSHVEFKSQLCHLLAVTLGLSCSVGLLPFSEKWSRWPETNWAVVEQNPWEGHST